ncbi:helix-turn-helix domain-containing protein [Trinickia sp. NRRL B-1857]|uniref:helix-turn-helix domain-containing protein n=1 Tax=Trinickia sp. NRRL B-1857 TaxID=3162879 RepID=UPI003D26DE7C
MNSLAQVQLHASFDPAAVAGQDSGGKSILPLEQSSGAAMFATIASLAIAAASTMISCSNAVLAARERGGTLGEQSAYSAFASVVVVSVHLPLVAPGAVLSLPLWTTGETAYYFRVEAQTIRNAISRDGAYDGLRPCRFGRRWYFKAAEVRAAAEGV